MRRFIAVSGIPAAGKSTVGRALAGEFGLPLLDKDDLLESLFESDGIGDSAWRSRLSRRADTMLVDAALAAENGAVLVSHWRYPEIDADTGTPVEWLSDLSDAELVEVYCRCEPAMAADRFSDRVRHPGHLDHLRTPAELAIQLQRLSRLGPLGLGRTIELDTSGPVDASSLVELLWAGE